MMISLQEANLQAQIQAPINDATQQYKRQYAGENSASIELP